MQEVCWQGADSRRSDVSNSRGGAGSVRVTSLWRRTSYKLLWRRQAAAMIIGRWAFVPSSSCGSRNRLSCRRTWARRVSLIDQLTQINQEEGGVRQALGQPAARVRIAGSTMRDGRLASARELTQVAIQMVQSACDENEAVGRKIGRQARSRACRQGCETNETDGSNSRRSCRCPSCNEWNNEWGPCYCTVQYATTAKHTRAAGDQNARARKINHL